MEPNAKQILEELGKLRADIRLVKMAVLGTEDDEGDLTDWAKEQLAKARSEDAKWFPIEEVKLDLLGR